MLGRGDSKAADPQVWMAEAPQFQEEGGTTESLAQLLLRILLEPGSSPGSATLEEARGTCLSLVEMEHFGGWAGAVQGAVQPKGFSTCLKKAGSSHARQVI